MPRHNTERGTSDQITPVDCWSVHRVRPRCLDVFAPDQRLASRFAAMVNGPAPTPTRSFRRSDPQRPEVVPGTPISYVRFRTFVQPTGRASAHESPWKTRASIDTQTNGNLFRRRVHRGGWLPRSYCFDCACAPRVIDSDFKYTRPSRRIARQHNFLRIFRNHSLAGTSPDLGWRKVAPQAPLAGRGAFS